MLRVFQGRGAATGENARIAGKPLYQAHSPGRLAARRILHGKEAVPGSSPGEGLNTCNSALFVNYRVPRDQGGLAGLVRPGPPKLPANRVLSDDIEHLLGREGIDCAVVTHRSEGAWKRAGSGTRVGGRTRLGTGLGDRKVIKGARGLASQLRATCAECFLQDN